MKPQSKPQTFSETDELRTDRRFETELPVVLNTVLDDQAGWIVDISQRGLRIAGVRAHPRMRVCVHFKGQYAEGTVRWVKEDQTIGVVLDQPLATGPLGDVWKRFRENVNAFGKFTIRPKQTFGRKT